MKKFRNRQPGVCTAQLLMQNLSCEASVDIQMGSIEEESGYGEPIAFDSRALRAAIERLSKQLEARANSLNKKCRTKDDLIHWQTRGRQELLRDVAGHLGGLCTKYGTTYALSIALKDYLRCLEKYEIDIEEEKRTPISSSEWLLQQWKAEGTAYELPAVFTDLTHLLSEHTLLCEQHILSLDGNNLVPLQRVDEEEQEKRKPGKEAGWNEPCLISTRDVQHNDHMTIWQVVLSK